MCQFKSAIVTAKGDLLSSPWTDSHEDLVRIFKLNDKPSVRNEPRFARVEFRPDEMKDLDEPKKYQLHIDEERTPSWFDAPMQLRIAERLRTQIATMIISGDVEILVGGEFILTKGAKVACVKTCRVLAMLGDASIRNVGDSASIRNVGDSASIRDVWGSASIRDVWGSASIRDVRGSASIRDVRGSASIRDVWGSASIQNVWGSASIRDVWGLASIRDVRDSVSVTNDTRIKKD